MSARQLRVVKVGGSLLLWPALPDRLRQWLAEQPPAFDVLVAGGGRLVDVLREADRAHGLDQATSHWLCVRAMAVNARLLAALAPEARWIASLDAGARAAEAAFDAPGAVAILDPWPFMQADQQAVDPPALPCRWDVTSDSIAARLAQRGQAAELVLLKSSLPAARRLEQAAVEGYVDGFFPRAAASLPVRCVNLRSTKFEQSLLGEHLACDHR